MNEKAESRRSVEKEKKNVTTERKTNPKVKTCSKCEAELVVESVDECAVSASFHFVFVSFQLSFTFTKARTGLQIPRDALSCLLSPCSRRRWTATMGFTAWSCSRRLSVVLALSIHSPCFTSPSTQLPTRARCQPEPVSQSTASFVCIHLISFLLCVISIDLRHFPGRRRKRSRESRKRREDALKP